MSSEPEGRQEGALVNHALLQDLWTAVEANNTASRILCNQLCVVARHILSNNFPMDDRLEALTTLRKACGIYKNATVDDVEEWLRTERI